jgi:hypothetical protein
MQLSLPYPDRADEEEGELEEESEDDVYLGGGTPR